MRSAEAAGAAKDAAPAKAADAADVVGALSRVMRAHGGGLVLEAGGPAVLVRYTGMCAACAGRLLCHENLVRPALEAAGAVSVEAPGTRADVSVMERLGHLGGAGGSARPG